MSSEDLGKCDVCRKNKPELTVTEVDKTGKKLELKLCAECAKARGVLPPEEKQLLADLLLELKKRVQDDDALLVCSNCGRSYAEFRTSGRLGCADCYAAFSARLNPIIKRIHGVLQHTGRVPQNSGKDAAREFEIERLRGQLKKAIAAEDYERAAQVRDQLKHLGGEV